MRRLLLLIGCLLLASPAWAQDATFVQGEGSTSSGTTSVNETLPNVTTGNMLWASVAWVHTADDDITITVGDSWMASWTAGTRCVNPGIGGAQGFYAFAVESLTTQVTATMSDNNGAPVQMTLHIAEVSGVDDMDPLEDEACAEADGVASLDVGTLDLATGGILLTGIQTGGARTFSVPSGYTEVKNPQEARAWASYRQVGAAGSYGATWTWTGGTSSTIGVHMAFNSVEASGAGDASGGGLLLRGVQ